MIYIGIDPGKTGAIATMDDAGKILHVFDTPETSDIATTLKDLEGTFKGELSCAIELVHARPISGASAMFTFGKYYGAAQGVLRVLDIPYILVNPKVWMKGVITFGNDKNKRKKQSIELAKQRYPQAVEFLKLAKHDGRADAMHIADYCRRNG